MVNRKGLMKKSIRPYDTWARNTVNIRMAFSEFKLVETRNCATHFWNLWLRIVRHKKSTGSDVLGLVSYFAWVCGTATGPLIFRLIVEHIKWGILGTTVMGRRRLSGDMRLETPIRASRSRTGNTCYVYNTESQSLVVHACSHGKQLAQDVLQQLFARLKTVKEGRTGHFHYSKSCCPYGHIFQGEIRQSVRQN